MATADDSINFQFTAQGQQLATQALAGNTKLDFTKAVASTDNHFSDDAATIAALTTLGNVKQTATITEVETVTNDDTEVRIPVTFDKSQVGDDYQLLSVGLYCKPDDGEEVLYAVAGLANPILMHQSVAGSVYSIALYVLVGTAENVTIKVDPAGSITQADLTAILAEYVKSADIKTVAYTDKPNVFTQQQTLSAGAVDGDGHAYVTEDKVPKTDLSGLQPKGDYATHADVTKANQATLNQAHTDGDNKYVSLTGNQTIAGQKTFSQDPVDKNGIAYINKQNAFDKTEDLIGTRNYLLGTQTPQSVTLSSTSGGQYYQNGYNIVGGALSKSGLHAGDTFLLSYDWNLSNMTSYAGFQVYFEGSPYTPIENSYSPSNVKALDVIPTSTQQSGHSYIIATMTDSANTNSTPSLKYIFRDGFTGTITFSNVRVYKSTVDIAWSPAPEDLEAYTDDAKQSAISTASADATAKANATQSAAISTASTDASNKASTAQKNAIATAAQDATTKANTAQANAIKTASSDAASKANSAQQAAISQATTLANNAKQAAINQAHTDVLAELTKRGYPTAIWTGTQAQYDAMASHDEHTEYRIFG